MNYYIGIDLGGTNIKGMIMNETLQAIISKSTPTPQNKTPESIFFIIINLIESMVAESEIDMVDVLGIGLGVPGLIDSRNNFVLNAANLNWTNVDAGQYIQGYFNKPVYMENDGNINALGEMYFGAGRGFRNILLLTLGTGLGSGFIIEGNILHGVSHVAAEAGHMIVESDGARCSCGKRGCFESCCSATALTRYACEAVKQNPDSLILQYASGNLESITGEMISKAWDEDDVAAKQVIEVFARKLSIGLVNLINLFNPEIIIISGGVSQLGERLLGPTRYHVENSLMHPVQHCMIVTGEMGIDAGVMGACYLVASHQIENQ